MSGHGWRAILLIVGFCCFGCASNKYVTRDELVVALADRDRAAATMSLDDILLAQVRQEIVTDDAITRAGAVESHSTREQLISAIHALRTARNAIVQNLCNAETIGYKRTRPAFADGGTVLLQRDFAQGSLENTNRPLDVAIEGDGFLRVRIGDAHGDGTGYTRNGNFFVNNEGMLVVGLNQDGLKIQPPITLPRDAQDIQIDRSGIVTYTRAGQNSRTMAGQLVLVRFMNPEGLAVAGGVFVETQSSGPATQCKAGEGGAGTFLQGFLEGSNVDSIREKLDLLRLIARERSLANAIAAGAGSRAIVIAPAASAR